MTAEMTADELPVPPIAEGEPGLEEDEEKRRRRKRALLLLLLGLLAMFLTLVIWYLLFRQPINPLPPIPESRLPGYSTSIFGSNNPMGIASSPDGSRIYAAETEGDRVVRVYDAGGNLVATAKPPESTGGDHVPVWVSIDPLTSEVYVTDRPTGQIYIYNSDGVYQRTLALAKPIPGWQPVGIAFDTAGLLYVMDLSGLGPKVQVIDRSATVVRTFGENEKLSFPNSLAVDKNGNVYVADSNNGRLLVFGPDGRVVAQVGRGAGEGNLGLPRGVAVDNQDRVFVGDATGQGVFVFRTLAADQHRLDYLGFFGGEGIGDGQFAYPNGVAVDGRGRIYVADTANDRIQVWSY
jgi:DNA-binding beta-propeller fold protein YncE